MWCADPSTSAAAARTDPSPPIDDGLPAGTAHALLAHRIRSAMQRYIQEADRRDRLKEVLLLEELSRLGATVVNLDPALAQVTRRLVDLAGVDFAAISGFDTQRVFCATRGHLDGSVDGEAREVEALVAGVGRPRPVGAFGVDPSLLDPEMAEIARRLGLRIILPVPLVVDSQPWGLLLVGRRDTNAYTGRQTARLENVAHLIGALIERSARRADSRTRDALVHDLMQPVTAALAMLEMLVADEALSPTGQMLAESMQRALSRVERVTGSGLDWARLDAEAVAAVDVRSTIVDAAGLVEHEYARQGLVLVRRLAPDLPPVRGDAGGLERILVNLLVNAREAMVGRSGTVLLTAEPFASAAGASVELRIRDHGPGIAPSIRDRLFEPYCSTKRQHGKRGLGLSSCREIVERWGGAIDAEPVEGEGACFRVRLPAVRSLAAVGVS